VKTSLRTYSKRPGSFHEGRAMSNATAPKGQTPGYVAVNIQDWDGLFKADLRLDPEAARDLGQTLIRLAEYAETGQDPIGFAARKRGSLAVKV